ncbi:uncharacterized protein FA14DRAFT_154582 [Meira miltonrushii]|uniref:Fibronectin type-III domain-containing protein n=1 Tax=Meira miltonrushii TaxID=1280837 RepID=A0A316VC95_9BASI|nr:uncharacterized protein FA14DRAFT_154582 [Meira miltonrushii]PWN35156.1 hypothetical protein FA14DRAFT_154582 [Meira miltonrushii]
MSQLLLALLVSVSGFIHLVQADLEFTTSLPQECTTFNVSWKPEMDAFPYSVYFLGTAKQVLSWRIESDYQPNQSEITFQYFLPKASSSFQSFIVAVVDSKGNGNSSKILTPTSIAAQSEECVLSSFYKNNSWTFNTGYITPPGFNLEQDPWINLQCGEVSHLPYGKHIGKGPFSLSLVPEHDKPITLNIPELAQTGAYDFNYYTVIPYKAGTNFFQFMSDSVQSAAGGGSEKITVGASQNYSCFQSGFKLPDVNTTNALPVGSNSTSFQNLPGAIPIPANDTGNDSNILNSTVSGQGIHGDYGARNLKSLLGGILGSSFGILLLAFVIYKVHQMLQMRQQKKHRMERDQFVDLGESINDQGSPGIKQSTLISPFFYESDRAAHGEAVSNDDSNAIGLTPIARKHNIRALKASLSKRLAAGLNSVSRSETIRSGIDNRLSLGNYTNNASEVNFNLADDLRGRSRSTKSRTQHLYDFLGANNSLRSQTGSIHSSVTNPFSVDGVLIEDD